MEGYSSDDETVKIMSANFKSVEDEISQALADSDSTAEGTDGPADSVVQTPATSDGTIDLSNQRFSIHYTRNVVSTDFGGEPAFSSTMTTQITEKVLPVLW